MLDCPKCGAFVDGLVCPVCGVTERAPSEPRRQRLPHGPIDPRVAAEIRRVLSKPKPDPKAWARKILREAAAGTYTYVYGIECAQEAIGWRERERGEDDV